MSQQSHLLTLPQLFCVGILLHTVAVLMVLSIEFVLVMDNLIFIEGFYLGHAAYEFHTIHESGNDEIVSPEEGEQPTGCEDRGKDGKGGCEMPFKEGVNSENGPASKDHHKKILRQIICGDDLKKGRGSFLHSYLRRLLKREIKSARGMS